MSHYITRLHQSIRHKGTPALVGLDPRFELLPQSIVESARKRTTDERTIVATAFEEFCFRLIDVVRDLVPAVKPQAAFFEQLGASGSQVLARVIRRARDAGLIVICDVKRSDIGSTAEAYARGYLAGADPDAAGWAADAITVNPYLGSDALQPFVQVAVERGAGLYILIRTSNPGAGLFQDLKSDSLPLYRHVARIVEELAAETCDQTKFGAVGGVVGATYPHELAELRNAMPHTSLLVPGYGNQGASAKDVAAAFSADGLGALINSSRAINFAYLREPFKSQYRPHEWEQAVEDATAQMIDELAENTPAGKLR